MFYCEEVHDQLKLHYRNHAWVPPCHFMKTLNGGGFGSGNGTHVDPDGTRMVDPEGRNLAQKMASSQEIR